MYLSKVFIRNYRSIEEARIEFKRGKNVIVGKNNSGKSNIIKAIDLVLGESSPDYAKTSNILDNDFYNGEKDRKIIIACVLTRETGESLDYDSLSKSIGFYKCNDQIKLAPDTFADDILKCFEMNSDNVGINNFPISGKNTKKYINSKEKNALKSELDDKYLFMFVFVAQYDEDDRLNKEIRLFYNTGSGSGVWTMAFRAYIRNYLIQSAIINSFRDPSKELRINNWSWYGKLLKNIVDTDNQKLRDALNSVKAASKEIFCDLNERLMNENYQIAFKDTELSFQFNHSGRDSTNLYKGTLIYVNDGFDSLLEEKGAGIQSAVIIGLFMYYIRNVAHESSSLLLIEEPELYLHPHARRVVSNKIDEFIELEEGRNQSILTTHSSEFFSAASKEINVIHVSKRGGKSTVASSVFNETLSRQIFLKKSSVDILFSDTIIYVEGGEKYLLEEYAAYYGTYINPKLGKNWMDDRNVSIIGVGGKHELYKYAKMFRFTGAKSCIVADFDYFCNDGLVKYCRELNFGEEHNEGLNTFKSQLTSFICDKKLNSIERYSDEKRQEIRDYLESLREAGVFVLEGDLEYHYTEAANELINELKKSDRNVESKERKPLAIVSHLAERGEPITDYVQCDTFERVFEYVLNE